MTNSFETEKNFTEIFAEQGWGKLMELLETGYRGSFMALRILKENGGEMTAGELAKKTGVTTARIAAMLNSLCRKNYVRRMKSASDGRSVVVRITPEGLCALERRKAEVDTFLNSYLNKLTDEETKTLIAVLTKLFR